MYISFLFFYSSTTQGTPINLHETGSYLHMPFIYLELDAVNIDIPVALLIFDDNAMKNCLKDELVLNLRKT